MGEMHAIDAGRMIALSHVLLLTVLVLPRVRGWERIYAAMIGLGVAAALLLPFLIQYNAPVLLKLLTGILQLGLTFWFWLFALASRSPEFRPGWFHWGILAAKVLLSLLWAGPGAGPDWFDLRPDERVIWRALVPGLFSLSLTAAAIVAAGMNLRDELNEHAGGLRRLLVYWGAAAFFAVVLVSAALRGPGLRVYGDWIIIALILAICARVHFLINPASSSANMVLRDSSQTADINPAVRKLAARIVSCFKDQELYREEGLTVGKLARRLEEKEYRVRRAINQVLGYRNFNVFLNEYRIEAARRDLLADLEVPVIRISMDLGYRSLAGFNRAFKEAAGMTPTSFRQSNSAKNPD